MRRSKFSDETIESLMREFPGFTRDIPLAVQRRALFVQDEQGYLCTPARDGKGGRGPSVFDLYNPHMLDEESGLYVPYLLSMKVMKESSKKYPSNVAVTTGTMRHIRGVILAARNGTKIPVLCYNYNKKQDQWYRFFARLDVILAEEKVHEKKPGNSLQGKVLGIYKTPRPSGHDQYGQETTRYYNCLKINVKPSKDNGHTNGWTMVDRPTLPTTAI